MIPVRVLIVVDSRPILGRLRQGLESVEGFEVIVAASPASGLLALARSYPDLLIVDPCSGGGTAEDWKCAVARHRASRPLSVLILSDRMTDHDRAILESLADLGLQDSGSVKELIETILTSWAWAGQEETLPDAA